jgi:hypothetical protein
MYRERYLDAYAALAAGYRAHVRWEPWRDLERRVASLLPALMLARIDGKSPVEYLTDERDRADVRAFAKPRVARAPATLHAVASAWARR